MERIYSLIFFLAILSFDIQSIYPLPSRFFFKLLFMLSSSLLLIDTTIILVTLISTFQKSHSLCACINRLNFGCATPYFPLTGHNTDDLLKLRENTSFLV